MRVLLAITFCLLCAGCEHVKHIPESSTTRRSGWGENIRQLAIKTYIYAQMATNVYRDAAEKDDFLLPKNVSLLETSPNNDIGFSYRIYAINAEGQLTRVVIAFRGTDEIQDWLYGNLLTSQNKAGLALFDRVRRSTPSGIPITVTGHSLGGAIATEISLQRADVNSIVFNSSPHFFSGGKKFENDRESVVEYGEALKILRIFGREATQRYTSIGCSSGSPVTQHEQYKLAVCLTQIASSDSEDAKESLKINQLPMPKAAISNAPSY